jgi:RNA polymerase sigma-70 factor (ECF subfamily)
MDHALATLPDSQRAVLFLAVVEEMTYEEIALVVGIPIGTVRSRLSRARSRLRHHFDASASSTIRPAA